MYIAGILRVIGYLDADAVVCGRVELKIVDVEPTLGMEFLQFLRDHVSQGFLQTLSACIYNDCGSVNFAVR